MKFVDLFAGLGGFHLALRHLGHECVFASEIDSALRETYSRNFNLNPVGDIRLTKHLVPKHDVLCAGFPCQPFSKAGFQEGYGHATNGTLFDEILDIVEAQSPDFIILENVANFEHHDEGNTWAVAKGSLSALGYDVRIRKFSPHQFGVPQIRERVYIAAARDGLSSFTWPEPERLTASIHSVLDEHPDDARSIPPTLSYALDVWQEFLNCFPQYEELPSFPIWSQEFGATYPVNGIDPKSIRLNDLKKLAGVHGKLLSSARSWEDVMAMLPSYAQYPVIPAWKQSIILKNRELYQWNKKWIDQWKLRLSGLAPSLQKFEWHCKGEVRILSKHILQARPSGIRVKRANWSPALVAQTTSQIPIIGWERRFMTVRECQRLQSMEALEFMPQPASKAYKALGNAVNVEVVERIARSLIGSNIRKRTESTSSQVSEGVLL